MLLLCVFVVLASRLPTVAGVPEYCAYVPANPFTVIDLGTETTVATAPPLSPNSRGIVLSPDGTRAYATNYDAATVSVIDTATLGIITTVPVAGSAIGIAITPSGDELYVANFISPGIVSVISTATNTVTHSLAVTTPHNLAISPDGERVYVASTGSAFSVIDTATKAVSVVSLDPETRGIAIAPDSSRAYVAQLGMNRVALVETSGITITGFVPVGTHPSEGIAVTPNGAFVYVANNDSNDVSVISTATDTVVATIPVGSIPYGLAIHPDGSRVYVINASASGGVSVIDTATQTVTGTIPLPGGGFAIAVGLIPSGCAVPSVSGRIGYYSAADRPVADVTVQALGPVQQSTMSDAAGAFSFAALEETSWTIEPRKVGGRGEAVSTLDAVYVLQAVAGLRTFTPLQRLACDVTGNGTISTLDAVRILQLVVGLRSQLPVADACGSDWGFMPMAAALPNQTFIPPLMATGSCQRGAIQFEPLEGVATGQNFLGFVFGDCTGNWLPEPAVGALRR